MKLKRLGVVAMLLVLPVLASCSSDDEKVATTAPPSTAKAGNNQTPTTAKKKDPNCGIFDKWATTLLYANKDKTVPTTANPIKALDDSTAALNAAVPSIAPSVQARTDLAKKKAGGQQLTDAEKQQDTDAAKKIAEWHSKTCGPATPPTTKKK